MPDTRAQTLPISVLVRSRCKILGLAPADLVRRCGYRNVAKGLRRLQQLHAGDVTRSVGLIGMLPPALGVPVDVVNAAVEETQRYLRESAEAEWRAAFKPHAIIMTDQERPSPLFVAAMIGVNVLLRADFDLATSPVTFVKQALDGVRRRRERWRGNTLPAFGRMVGFIINYAPDFAVRFDLEGNAVEQFDQAYRIGDLQLSIGGRAVSHAELAAVFSRRQRDPARWFARWWRVVEVDNHRHTRALGCGSHVGQLIVVKTRRPTSAQFRRLFRDFPFAVDAKEEM
jgi:hypothetical protein